MAKFQVKWLVLCILSIGVELFSTYSLGDTRQVGREMDSFWGSMFKLDQRFRSVDVSETVSINIAYIHQYRQEAVLVS